jgi:hypothetical protein
MLLTLLHVYATWLLNLTVFSLSLSFSVSVSLSVSVRQQRPSIGLPQTVMMKVLMKISVVWDLMLCDLVEVDQCFLETCHLLQHSEQPLSPSAGNVIEAA